MKTQGQAMMDLKYGRLAEELGGESLGLYYGLLQVTLVRVHVSGLSSC